MGEVTIRGMPVKIPTQASIVVAVVVLVVEEEVVAAPAAEPRETVAARADVAAASREGNRAMADSGQLD